MRKIRIAIIGFGRMGRKYLKELMNNQSFEVVYICDIDNGLRQRVETVAESKAAFVNDSDIVFDDESIEAVALCESSDSRYLHFKKALSTGKHVFAEKPVAMSLEQEKEIDSLVKDYHGIVGVNLLNRNIWYHRRVAEFVRNGELGELAIIRVCHLTPGLAPKEGHRSEGPAFHDCGMHYVDIARWYAQSEYETWHAVGVRMWNYKEPWWVSCHGTFENGVVFDITQGHNYGQMSKDQVDNCYVDIIGTKGVAHINIDVKDCYATVSIHGVTQTLEEKKHYADKNLDVMLDVFAKSILSGENLGLPTVHDSVVASEMSWKMYYDALRNNPPCIGTDDELEEILQRRKNMETGYGLLKE
ncbi:MAG: Gfo/Idh/MocA family protein [Candidatus Limimorpha sp.]